MTQEGDIARLEETVTGLLKKFTALKAEKSALEKSLAQKVSENEELQARLNNMQSERSDVSDRVSSLLEKIEQWETEGDEELFEPVAEDVVTETVETQTVGEKRYEDPAEARQGKLFSIEPSAANS